MSQCERCGADMTEEETEGNYQEHDCAEVLAERHESMRDAFD